MRLAHPFNPDFHFITSKCETCKKYVQINDSKEPALVSTYMVGWKFSTLEIGIKKCETLNKISIQNKISSTRQKKSFSTKITSTFSFKNDNYLFKTFCLRLYFCSSCLKKKWQFVTLPSGVFVVA